MKLAQLERCKKDVPFSQRLNDFLVEKIATLIEHDEIGGVDFTDSDDYGTFEAISEYFERTGRLMIWDGASENTIFGNHQINLLFRAWHDYVHIKNGFEFTTEGESMTAFAQIAELPHDWLFEKQLILCEVIGQVLYVKYHNDFPVDQRGFTINYLLYGAIDWKY